MCHVAMLSRSPSFHSFIVFVLVLLLISYLWHLLLCTKGRISTVFVIHSWHYLKTSNSCALPTRKKQNSNQDLKKDKGRGKFKAPVAAFKAPSEFGTQPEHVPEATEPEKGCQVSCRVIHLKHSADHWDWILILHIITNTAEHSHRIAWGCVASLMVIAELLLCSIYEDYIYFRYM